MALYQDSQLVTASKDTVFTDAHDPGIPALYAGVYRCMSCGHEIVAAHGDTLPQDFHPRHSPGQEIRWKLVVYAEQHKF